MAKRRVITEDQYEKVGYLARRLVPKKVIASELGYTESAFYKRLKKDATLREVLQSNYDEGAIGLYVTSYYQATDHHITRCKSCGQSADLTEHFLPACPWCNSSDVTHKYIRANIEMLLHMCRHHLGQTEKSLRVVKTNNLSDDHRKAEIGKKFSEEEHRRKMKNLLPFLIQEYGPVEEPERGHDDLLVDVKKCA